MNVGYYSSRTIVAAGNMFFADSNIYHKLTFRDVTILVSTNLQNLSSDNTSSCPC